MNYIGTSTAMRMEQAASHKRSIFPNTPNEFRMVVKWCPFLLMYDVPPQEHISLFDLEALVVRRMELLAYVDGLRNSPTVNGMQELLQKIQKSMNESFAVDYYKETHGAPIVPSAPKAGELEQGVYLNSNDADLGFGFNAIDDSIAHLSCRLVFCQSEQWREWFVKNEELIFRSRVEKLVQDKPAFRTILFEAAQVPCQPLDYALLDKEQIDWLSHKYGGMPSGTAAPPKRPDLFLVPISHAAKAMRKRNCLCLNGYAVVTAESVFDAYLATFRAKLHQGLQDAAVMRQQVLMSTNDDATTEALSNVLRMLDSFFSRFIVDPADAVKPTKEGAVTAAQIPGLAQCHFPPCMRRTEEHLRREHHLKHTGRWTYGLFLKAIGLSLEDSLKLFGSLLTLKASKDFEKSAYAYNIRHAYGKEGKRTSYSSLTCTSIVNQPPNLDKHDCHGCPFRFKDESALRSLLSQPRPSVTGNGAMVKVAQHDIEDIIQDSRDMHYTRACFKYFTASHSGAKLQRDSLFRSPYEYYSASVQLWNSVAAGATPSSTGDGSATSPSLKRERGDEVTPTRQGPVSEVTKVHGSTA